MIPQSTLHYPPPPGKYKSHHCGFQTSNATGHKKTQLCFSCRVTRVPTIITNLLDEGRTAAVSVPSPCSRSLLSLFSGGAHFDFQAELFTWTFCCGNLAWLVPRGGRQSGTRGEESPSSTGTQKSCTSGCSYLLQHDLRSLCCQVQGETNK